MEVLLVRFKDWVWVRFPNEPERGMKTRFANLAGVKPAYFSHVINGRKEVGHAMARKLESGMRKLGHEFDDVVDGWMDNDHDRPKPKIYRDISLHDALEVCFDVNPIETQHAVKELVNRLERVAKQPE